MKTDGDQATAGPANALLARLRRVPKRNLALVLLLPVLVALWLPLLTGTSRSRGVAPPPGPGAPPSAPAAETAGEVTGTDAVTAAASLSQRLQQLDTPFRARWSPAHDPAPFRAPSIVSAETVSDAAAELVPSSIVLSEGQTPVAIIGGRTYRPGDQIHGRNILGIEERRVLFREGNKTYAVSLPEPTLRKGP